MTAKVSLEERVAQLQAKQRRQREGWAEQGRCEECGSDDQVEGANEQGFGIYRLSCVKCRNRRAGVAEE